MAPLFASDVGESNRNEKEMAMDIREVLKKDHREALDLMEKICSSEDKQEIKIKFDKVYGAIIAHAHAEQKVLYTFLKESKEDELRKLAMEGELEHKIVEEVLDMLKGSTAKGSEKWMARCKVLKELLEHHIEEEEGTMFDLMEDACDEKDLERLGEEMMKKEEEEKKMAA